MAVAICGLACSQAQGLTFYPPGQRLDLYYPGEDIISISTGTYKAIHLAPSVATVIRADEIEAMGARSLDEVLETVPGLHVSKSLYRNSSIYSMRGIHTAWNPHVLFMINGIPFKDYVSGSRPPLFRLPVENIALIEVVRGPGSAIFGADAFAGVINVITKEAIDLGGFVAGGGVGSFDTTDAWLQYGGKAKHWDVALSLEYSSSDGDRDRIINSDLQSQLDSRFDTDASLAPGPLESRYDLLNNSITLERQRWTIWLNSWHLRDAGVGPGGFQALDPVGAQDDDQYVVSVEYDAPELTPNWRLTSRLSYRVLEQSAVFRLLPPGTEVPIGPDGNVCLNAECVPAGIVQFTDGLFGNPGGRQSELRAEAASLYHAWDGHRIRLALGMDRDELDPHETKNFGPGVIDGTTSPIDGALIDVTGTEHIFVQWHPRNVRYFSLQDEWRFANSWELTAGVRYDHYSDFGGTTNPRLALVWETDDSLTTKLLYGRAFRAPSLTELYFENNPVTIGNPQLAPERIDMLEIALDYRPSPSYLLIANLFTYRARDLIEFVDGVAQNFHKQTGHGLELETKWFVTERWLIKGNFALQYSEDAEDGSAIPNAPKRQFFLATHWQPTINWSLYAQTKAVMGRPRAMADERSAIADNITTDFTVHYQPGRGLWGSA